MNKALHGNTLTKSQEGSTDEGALGEGKLWF